jgi:predicted transposase YbfD/YdcC
MYNINKEVVHMIGIVEIFQGIPDPRSGNATLHKLEEVLTIAIMAILSECTQFTEMELFGIEKSEWLRTFLELPNGIPSHDTFGDIFAALDPKEVQKCFMEWVETIREKISGEVVAIDGKTICGSKDTPKNKRAVHMVSAWASQNGLVLGELATSDKSNEITAIPELLKLLYLKGCIVTIDAMGTQKDIAKAIVEREADYVLAVKENQPTLHSDISEYFESEQSAIRENGNYAKINEKSHGRYEQRECYATTDISWLYGRNEWENLSGIGMIVSQRQKVGSDIIEKAVHYVIYSKASMTAQEILNAKRSHWSIENTLHWTLDVIFGEDNSRMRVGNSAENVSVFRHLAINLIRSEKTSKGSLNLKRKRCMLSQDYLLKIIGVS